MRFLCLFSLSVVPVSAQIFADVSTTLGDFSIELYHEESPRAVANLITLAEGTRPWIDSTTGEIRRGTPYYEGIIFHRVIGDFMNQAGSQDGTGSDGPGYSFPDELDNGLLHDEPYLLSAANSGPNTNGSQFFTTVVPTPWLDGIHTVYGKIVTGTDTLDTINDTPVSGSTPLVPVVIQSMTIRRVGAEAIAFDEFGQGLPEVTEPVVDLVPPGNGEAARLSLIQPVGTTLKVFQSTDLQTWNPASRYVDFNGLLPGDYSSGVVRQKEFFRPSLVQWPSDATFPNTLVGETINISSNIGSITVNLTESGTVVVNQGGGDIVGQIDYTLSTFEYDGYGATYVIYSSGLVPIRLRLGGDLPMLSPLTGRVGGTAFNAARTSISGTFSVTLQ